MEHSTTTSAALAAAVFADTLRLWGGLSPCRTMEKEGFLCLSTGVAIPDQNYALRTADGDIAAMTAGAWDFFTGEKIPFTWWIPPSPRAADESREVGALGLALQCSPPAMVLPLFQGIEASILPGGVEIKICANSGDGREWARASLAGFDSPLEHLEAFEAFALAMTAGPSRELFRLLTLLVEGVPAATSMVTLPGEAAGIFYFSVLREFRRMGLGKILLEATLEEAKKAGCTAAALSASPMGFPLYKSFGFQERGSFLVHSATPDACY